MDRNMYMIMIAYIISTDTWPHLQKPHVSTFHFTWEKLQVFRLNGHNLQNSVLYQDKIYTISFSMNRRIHCWVSFAFHMTRAMEKTQENILVHCEAD